MDLGIFIPDSPRFVGAALPAKLASRRFREISMACEVLTDVRYRRTRRTLSVEPLGPGETAQGVFVDAWERGGDRFSHWLFDVWPKLIALTRLGLPLDRGLIVNDCGTALREETLRALGLDVDHLLLVDKKGPEVLATTVLRIEGGRDTLYTPPWVIEAARTAFLPRASPAAGTRKIYVSRAHAARRRVVNEPELVAWLAERGFETIALEQLSLAEAAAVMCQAAVVVAPHGAGLANIVFCPPGARIVEFYSHHISPEYWLLAARMGLDYACVECPSPEGVHLSDLPAEVAADRDICNPVDIVADLKRIAQAL